MLLKLPYIDPVDFASALTGEYGFTSQEVWNAHQINLPEVSGVGSLLLFVRKDIHFFRGKWTFKNPTAFLSPDEVGKNNVIDLRISSDGIIDSAALKGQDKFQYDITNVDGMRLFIPERYLPGDRRKIAATLDYFCLNPHVSELFRQLFYIDYEALGNSILVESKMLEFLHLFVDFLKKADNRVAYGELSQRQLACLKMAKELIDQQTPATVSINELSRKLGINECDLKSGFRKLFGLPIHQYVIKTRLERARELIIHTDTPIQHICDQVGYTNRGHFAQLYLKVYGVTPRNDRQRAILSVTQ